MAHRVHDHQSRLPVAQATVLALPPSSQAKVTAVNRDYDLLSGNASAQMIQPGTCSDVLEQFGHELFSQVVVGLHFFLTLLKAGLSA